MAHYLKEKWPNFGGLDPLCDVTIVVENETFRAHRNVLAVGSDYMRALFCEDWSEDSTKSGQESED